MTTPTMTVAELRAVLADAPDDATIHVVTSTIDGSTFRAQGADYIEGDVRYPRAYNDGKPFVQVVLAVDLDSRIVALED